MHADYIDRLITLNESFIYTCEIFAVVFCQCQNTVSSQTFVESQYRPSGHSAEKRQTIHVQHFCRFYLEIGCLSNGTCNISSCAFRFGVISTWLCFVRSSDNYFFHCCTFSIWFFSFFFATVYFHIFFSTCYCFSPFPLKLSMRNSVHSRIVVTGNDASELNSIVWISSWLYFPCCHCIYSKRQISMFTWDV